MKAVRLILACFFFPIIFYSCKKDKELSISGKWIAQEYYNGYVDGGDFKWHLFDDQYKHPIEFTSDGYYIDGSLQGNCNGTYTITNHDLKITTPCGTSTSSFYFEYLPNYLIIYYFVREGFIRIKYSRVN